MESQIKLFRYKDYCLSNDWGTYYRIPIVMMICDFGERVRGKDVAQWIAETKIF